YTEVMGMELVSTVIDDRIPSTGDPFPYFHLFFRMQDGSTIAFFESPGVPPRSKVSHPAYEIFDHIALHAKDPDEVLAWEKWLRGKGLDRIGPSYHDGRVMSIYCHDPIGIRLEITTPTDPDWNNHTERAYRDLKLWVDAKNAAKREGRDITTAMTEFTQSVR